MWLLNFLENDKVLRTKYTSLKQGYGNQAALVRVDLDSHFAMTFATD